MCMDLYKYLWDFSVKRFSIEEYDQYFKIGLP